MFIVIHIFRVLFCIEFSPVQIMHRVILLLDPAYRTIRS
jgi:hypothetical protein